MADALEGVTRLGIETSPFIYFVEKHPVYLDRVRAILARVDAEELAATSSVITLTEVLTMPIAKGNTAYEQAYVDMLLNSNGITIIPVSISIARRAAQLRARHNLRTPDAIHVATALEAGCQAFLTNDLGLKRVSEIRVLVLDELELDETPDEE